MSNRFEYNLFDQFKMNTLIRYLLAMHFAASGHLCHAQTSGSENIAAEKLSQQSGFLQDAKLTLAFRNYAERIDIEKNTKRVGWVPAVQARFESGYTNGPIGFGLDISPYGALKLNGGQGSRNLVRLEADGSGQNSDAWSYLGGYALKAKLGNTQIKYGLQTVSNPFLEPYDIRALPPSFRGLLITNNSFAQLNLSAGSFDAVVPRGATRLQDLSTSYGGIAFKRFTFVGADWNYAEGGTMSAYINQAQDIWQQEYFSLSQSYGSPAQVKWTAKADLYLTRDKGKQLQAGIDNKAYSLTISAQHGASIFSLGYQRILGEQFFDFLRETSGIYLNNSVASDYNAPHEQSVQLRYKFDGKAIGMPAWQASVWAVRGWGVEANHQAQIYAASNSLLHNVYWKGAAPIGGTNSEMGANFRYTVQDGRWKNLSIYLMHVKHNVSADYPSKNFVVNRLMINYPLKIF